MKTISIIAITISIIAILISGYALSQKVNLGASVVPIFYYGATNSSFTSPTTATTTNPILSRDDSRTNAIVCNNSAYTIFLHQNSQATTTGVAINSGIPLSPVGLTTSTANICMEFPGFKGYLYGISGTAASGTISSWK